MHVSCENCDKYTRVKREQKLSFGKWVTIIFFIFVLFVVRSTEVYTRRYTSMVRNVCDANSFATTFNFYLKFHYKELSQV